MGTEIKTWQIIDGTLTAVDAALKDNCSIRDNYCELVKDVLAELGKK